VPVSIANLLGYKDRIRIPPAMTATSERVASRRLRIAAAKTTMNFLCRLERAHIVDTPQVDTRIIEIDDYRGLVSAIEPISGDAVDKVYLGM
jgi:hypothetical protein